MGERRIIHNADDEISKAFSWLSLIVEPLSNQPISIDIAKELSRLQTPRVYSASTKPYERFAYPRNARTTIDSLILSDELYHKSDLMGDYLNIEKSGNIEYVNNRDIFLELEGLRFFEYVPLVGLVWQFVFVAKGILGNVGYTGGVRYLVNLVGTQDTLLKAFSNESGMNDKRWSQPFTPADHFGNLIKLKCPTPNLQMSYELVIGNLNESESRKIVDDVARQLSLAYNHQSEPRCFNYGTNTFPWNQYLQSVS